MPQVWHWALPRSWNGAAVIGGLLILLGFAVFSDGNAGLSGDCCHSCSFFCASVKSVLSADPPLRQVFTGDFISEDKSPAGVLWFLIQMSGIFFAGAVLLLPLLKKRLHRVLTVSCLFPVVFALLFFADSGYHG